MPAVSKSQQKFFGIVRAIQKGEMAPTTPETAEVAASMKKKDVKDFASTKHKGLPEKKEVKEGLFSRKKKPSGPSKAYYGGEEQRKKDEKKAAYEKQLKKMLPKRAFDQLGREIDPRSGKPLKEGIGLSLARAIDKTKPPLGRPSLRRSISQSLKIREVDKTTKKNRTFKHADSPGKKSFKDFTKDVEAAKNKK